VKSISAAAAAPMQRAAGFEDSTEDFTAYLKMAGGPCVDEAKCDLYAAEALNHYAWLKAQGVPYRGNYLPGKHIEPTDDSTLIWSGSEAAARPFCHKAKPAPRGHVIQHMGWGGGRPLVDILEAKARALGVEVHTDARAVALVIDGDRIVGIVVRIDNQPRFVKARQGRCARHRRLRDERRDAPQILPRDLQAHDDPIGDKDDGSGIMLGLGAGGDAIHMEQFFTTCPWTMPESHAKACS
jgi:3-oxo-5alpha-steroid 4-dehydrogenase